MFFRILKKDLKRKKTTNIIVLLFILLATMFISGSISSILSISNGLNNYFEKADLPDYLIAQQDCVDLDKDITSLKNINGVSDVTVCEAFIVDDSAIHRIGEKRDKVTQSIGVSINNPGLVLYDMDRNIVTEVEEGTILLSSKNISNDNFSVGDVVELDYNGKTKSYKIVGAVYDAAFGSSSVSLSHIVMNDKDYNELSKDGDSNINLYNIKCDDVKQVENNINISGNILVSISVEVIEGAYSLDIIVAMVFVIISITLIIVACVVLKFTIYSTIQEEFREIGVMKAIGIGNKKIRFLYLIKYLVLALVGSIIGFFGGIPFGNFLIKQASKTIMLENKNSIVLGIISSILVIVIVFLLSYGYTRKIKRLSPIDAVSNNNHDTKLYNKRWFNLKKYKGKSISFLAFNNIFKCLKKYTSMIIAYTLLILLVFIESNAIATYSGKHMINLFGMQETDVCIQMSADELEENNIPKKTDEKEQIEEVLNYISNVLKENNMDGKVFTERSFYTKITFNDSSTTSTSNIGINTKAEEYTYYKGKAPTLVNEIAISSAIAKKIGANIGDTVTIDSTTVSGEFVVSAIYQSCINFGEGIRFNENVDYNITDNLFIVMPIYITFNDNPSDKVVEERVEILKEKIIAKNVLTCKEYINKISGLGNTLVTVKIFALLVTCVIVGLITILLEKSFSLEEKQEIALMKAIGFKNSKIYLYHVLRFVFVGIISTSIAWIFAYPATILTLKPIFAYIGANAGVTYEMDFLDVFLVNPCIVLGVTIVFTFITSLFTKSIKAYDTASIE